MSHLRINKNEILKSDYLDIIYDGHNKNYGGYQLRKNYSKRVIKSLMILLIVCGIITGYGIINASIKGKFIDIVMDKPYEFKDIKPEITPIQPPPPVLPPALPPAKPLQKFTDPVIDNNDKVPPDDVLPNQNTITTPGPKTEQGDMSGIEPVINTTSKYTGVIPVATLPEIRVYVEQMPAPMFDLNEYLEKNLHYPEQARESNIQGRVGIKFVVNEDGAISNVTLIKGIGAGCDEEAKRVIAAMPNWKPGKQNGIPVKVYFTLPIIFKLD